MSPPPAPRRSTPVSAPPGLSLDSLRSLPGLDKLGGPLGGVLSSVLAASGAHSGTGAADSEGEGDQAGGNSTRTRTISSGSGDTSKAVLTVREYDLQELRRMGSAVFFEALSASYMHFVSKVSVSVGCFRPGCTAYDVFIDVWVTAVVSWVQKPVSSEPKTTDYPPLLSARFVGM